jgi:hypothetical protein
MFFLLVTNVVLAIDIQDLRAGECIALHTE